MAATGDCAVMGPRHDVRSTLEQRTVVRTTTIVANGINRLSSGLLWERLRHCSRVLPIGRRPSQPGSLGRPILLPADQRGGLLLRAWDLCDLFEKARKTTHLCAQLLRLAAKRLGQFWLVSELFHQSR